MYDSLLFIGGARPPEHALSDLSSGALFVAAADSGLHAAQSAGFVPNLICGDMDSIENDGILQEYERAEKVIFDRAKDETDTEIGLRLLRERGYLHTVVCGGGASGRPDHHFGVLWSFEKPHAPTAWLESDGEICAVEQGMRLAARTEPGTVISCFPVSDGPYRFSSSGLRWPLEGLAWSRSTAGISNEVTDQEFTVRSHSGRLLVVRPYRVDGTPNGNSLLKGSWHDNK